MAKDKGYIRRPTNPQPKHPKLEEREVRGTDEELFHVHIPTEQEVVTKAKSFWDHYGKMIIIAGSVIVAALLGYIGYKKFYKEPREEKANELVFAAESVFDKMAVTGFSKDSVNITLNGGQVDGKNITGLLSVMNKFGGTAAANRAAYMTGASYLHLKEFDKAIKYLKEFKGNGADQIEAQAYMMLGHAYAEQKKTGEALDYYKKAANLNTKDEIISGNALSIAANYALSSGKTQEAIDLFKQLKDKYPSNPVVMSGEVEKNLAKLGVFTEE